MYKILSWFITEGLTLQLYKRFDHQYGTSTTSDRIRVFLKFVLSVGWLVGRSVKTSYKGWTLLFHAPNGLLERNTIFVDIRLVGGNAGRSL